VAGELRHEERISLALQEDGMRERAGGVVEHCGHVALDVLLLQPLDVHARGVPVAEHVPEVCALRSDALSDRADDQDVATSDLSDPVTHDLERCGVGVVQIVEDQDARRALRSERQDAHEHVEQSVSGRALRRRRLVCGRRSEGRDRPCELAQRRSEPGLVEGQPPAFQEISDDLDERPQRWGLARLATETPGDRESGRERLGLDDLDDARLADSGLADEHAGGAVPARGACHRPAHELEDAVTPDEGQPVKRGSRWRHRLRPLAGRDGPDEPIAPPVHVGHEFAFASLVPERLSQARHRDGDHVLGDGLPSPNPGDELAFRDQIARVLEQHVEQSHHEHVRLDDLAVARQLERSGVQLEFVEAEGHEQRWRPRRRRFCSNLVVTLKGLAPFASLSWLANGFHARAARKEHGHGLETTDVLDRDWCGRHVAVHQQRR
jgi:hypothetical protein